MNALNTASAALLAGVLNTLWQSAAATALVWLALHYTRMSAAARHRVWWVWLAVLLVLPALPPIEGAPRRAAPVRQAAVVAPAAMVAFDAAPPASAPVQVRPVVEVRARRWPLVAFWAWLGLVALQTLRLFWSYLHLRRIKREAYPPKLALRENFEAWIMSCAVRRGVQLLVSDKLASPMAVGFWNPAVILPESLIGNLSAAEMDHVMLHELAHVARRDDWTNLLVRFASALLIWNPAAAWVLRHIDREREMACDDWVVAATGEARPYAASLARLFELCWTKRSEMLATGMAGRRSNLGQRIEMLVRRGTAPRSLARVAVCSAVLLILLVAGARSPRWLVFAQDARPRPVRQLPPPNPESFLGALVQAGYGDLSVDDIILMKSRNISPDFLRGMANSGWGKLSPQQLVDLRTHGVSPEYAREMKTAGIRDLNIGQVIGLRQRGVPAEYAREVHSLGFGPYGAEQIIDLFTHGARPELMRALKDGGFTHLSPSEIFDAQRSGLQSSNLREAKQYGSGLSLSQIIRLKRAGVI
jgi:beta-lactamase regulating signal transducer with metallopeptidase domain